MYDPETFGILDFVQRHPIVADVDSTAMLTGEERMPIATARPLGYRPRPTPLWPSREAFFTEAALFILGVAGLYSVNIIGALPGSEVLLFPLLPVLLLTQGSEPSIVNICRSISWREGGFLAR